MTNILIPASDRDRAIEEIIPVNSKERVPITFNAIKPRSAFMLSGTYFSSTTIDNSSSVFVRLKKGLSYTQVGIEEFLFRLHTARNSFLIISSNKISTNTIL
jgi:hypothetical protein